MVTALRKLFGVSTATTNDLAHLDIQRDGMITGVYFDLMPTTWATGDQIGVELSFTSTGQMRTSDTRGVIASLRTGSNITTSGQLRPSNFQQWIGGLFVPVRFGDRIYMHTLESGAPTTDINIYIYIAASARGSRTAGGALLP